MPDLLMTIPAHDALPHTLAFIGGAWSSLWPYLLMILGFSVIIFVHELGHFMAAKWAGVKVERFAIGFGRELFGFTKGETRYSFNLLPLGGYVKMLGQEDFDDKEKELVFSEDPRSFVNKPVLHRMVIVSAGVVMNVLFACLLFMIVFMIGMSAVTPTIGYVEPDSPADMAGLLPGDRLVRINGERILEFAGDVTMAISLAAPHEPIEFIVEREGEMLPPLFVTPDYRRPENTREARRQVIGVAPGVTREIAWVGPEVDAKRESHPRVGDVIVEVDGRPVDESNINILRELIPFADKIVVERKDPQKPEAAPRRVEVEIPPQLTLIPADATDPESISLLGLTPMVKFSTIDPAGRAQVAGLEVGDVIISFGDQPHPTHTDINRAIRHNPERDVAFVVRKPEGKTVSGFVRPKQNRFGAGTIQAAFDSIPDVEKGSGPQVVFTDVPSYGVAADAGIKSGDVVVAAEEKRYPSPVELSRLISRSSGQGITLTVESAGGNPRTVSVVPIPPGAIDATFSLVANEVMQVAEVVEQVDGRPTPAAKAGIPAGATILRVGEEPIDSWIELIDAFRRNAGETVRLAYKDPEGKAQTADFEVPPSLRTKLGIAPGSRILSIDGRESIEIRTARGMEEVHIGYHEGTREILRSLVGQEDVPVVYRPNPIAEPQTAYVDVTSDMVDPWLGRVTYSPSVDVAIKRFTLKGENVVDAIGIGLHKTYTFVMQVYVTIKRMVFSQSVGVENMSGPLGIVSIGGQIARAGLVEFLYFMAIISANLAVINFLPLPIVDGGLMVFLIIEGIKGSPVSLRVQVATQMIGLFLIIGAFLFVTYNDILRIVG